MIPKIALTYKWEKETLDYLKLPGVTLSFAQTITLDDQIKIIKGGGTITLLAQSVNISKINGLAFLTNPSTDMRKFKGFKLSVKAAGKTLVGWVKAVGTGETYTDLVTGDNSTFASDTGFWKKGASWTITGGKANVNGILDGGIGTSLRREMMTVGTLFAWGYEITDYTSGKIAFPHPWLITNQEAIGTYAGYITCVNTTASFNRSPSGTSVLSVDNVILKQVLTPSALGCTIVSTIEGAVQSWTSDDGINPNSLTFDIDITNS